MASYRYVAAMALLMALGACAGTDPATRNVPLQTADVPLQTAGIFSTPGAAPAGAKVVQLTPRYDVAEVRVTVPQSLKVSEANVFYPMADIVWRGEPRGDRYAQVAAIFQDAAASATQRMTKGPEVVVELTVARFHSLTEKTRYTVGGTHSLKFDLTVRDARTGAVIDGPRRIDADIAASGGSKAIAEDQAGRTQRVVIVERLTEVIRRELSQQTVLPGGSIPTSRLDGDLRLRPAAVR